MKMSSANNTDHRFYGNETEVETNNSQNGSYLHKLLEKRKQKQQLLRGENIQIQSEETNQQATTKAMQHLQLPHDHYHHHLQGHTPSDEKGQSINSSRSPSISSSRPSSPFIWRPIMPGYTSEKGNAEKIEDLDNDLKKENGRRFGWASRRSVFEPVGSEVSFKKAIPALPKFLAYVCFVCNCFVPGMGTFVSGISIGCHLSISRNGPEVPLSHVICVNIRAAFLQLITTPIFFIGWFWSVVWAVAFVIISDEYETLKSQTSTITTTTTITTISTTTTTINPEALPRDNSTQLIEPSIIVLHQAPIIIQPRPSPTVIRRLDTDIIRRSQSNVSVSSRRSQRMRRRANIRRNGRTINPILMDPSSLEHLVHHSSIVPLPDNDFVALTTAKDAL